MQSNNVAYQFPVRPRPLKNESVEGYILRLGAMNGRNTKNRIADIVGIRLTDSMYEVGNPRYRTLIESLSKTIRLEANQLDNFFVRLSFPLTDNDRFIQNIKLDAPRVCSTCCSHDESRYIKQDWHLAHHTHCDVHQVRLIEKCPCCQYPLQSTAAILNGCSKCGLQWEDYCALPTEVPIYQKVFQSLSQVEQADYISVLYKALVIISRPYDCAYEPLRKVPFSSTDIVYQLNQAFAFLTSKQFQNKLYKMRKDKLLADEKLLFLSKKQIDNLVLLPQIKRPIYLMQHISRMVCAPIEDNGFINKPREKFLVNGTEYCYQVSKNTAASLLQLDIKSIDYLMDSNRINFVRQKGSTTGAFIHLFEIDLFIKMLTNTVKIKRHVGDVDNLISMEKLRKGLKFFNADLTKLISILIDNPIQLYYCSPVVTISFNELYVDRDDITSLLEEQFIPSFNEQVSNTKIREMCFLNKEQYSALKVKFKLTDIDVKYKYSFVSPKKLTTFFTKYMLLNRWVKIHDVKLKSLIKYLETQPDLIRNLLVNEHNIVLYENTEKLKKALNRFLILTSDEPQKLIAFCF